MLSAIREIFERKFDGFPASSPKNKTSPEGEDNGLGLDIDIQDLIDELLEENAQPDIPTCGDTLQATLVADEGEEGYVLPDDFVSVISAWFDGLLGVNGVDYAIGEGFLYPTNFDAEVIVKIKYV